MSDESRSTGSRDSAEQRIQPGRRPVLAGDGVKRQWLVRLEAGDERVEADEVEVLASGALAFYRSHSRRESERTLLVAWGPGAWRRCQLERDA